MFKITNWIPAFAGMTLHRHCEGFSPWQSLVFKGLLRRFAPRNDGGCFGFWILVIGAYLGFGA
jgi:hypothetical protein